MLLDHLGVRLVDRLYNLLEGTFKRAILLGLMK